MKKALLIIAFSLLSGGSILFAQATDEDRKKGSNDQDALEESMLSPETKKKMKAYEKQLKKTRKEKEKRNAITRKQAEKKSAKRLNNANAKTRQKKKRYVKTHNK